MHIGKGMVHVKFLFGVCVFRENIRKLVKDGYIIHKPTVIHSRSRACRMNEAKAKGRHSGYVNLTI